MVQPVKFYTENSKWSARTDIKIRFMIVSSTARRQLADNKTDSSCKFLRDTHAFLLLRSDMSRASLRVKNLFERRAWSRSERCVFCLNLLRLLSKLAELNQAWSWLLLLNRCCTVSSPTPPFPTPPLSAFHRGISAK